MAPNAFKKTPSIMHGKYIYIHVYIYAYVCIYNSYITNTYKIYYVTHVTSRSLSLLKTLFTFLYIYYIWMLATIPIEWTREWEKKVYTYACVVKKERNITVRQRINNSGNFTSCLLLPWTSRIRKKIKIIKIKKNKIFK